MVKKNENTAIAISDITNLLQLNLDSTKCISQLNLLTTVNDPVIHISNRYAFIYQLYILQITCNLDSDFQFTSMDTASLNRLLHRFGMLHHNVSQRCHCFNCGRHHFMSLPEILQLKTLFVCHCRTDLRRFKRDVAMALQFLQYSPIPDIIKDSQESFALASKIIYRIKIPNSTGQWV